MKKKRFYRNFDFIIYNTINIEIDVICIYCFFKWLYDIDIFANCQSIFLIFLVLMIFGELDLKKKYIFFLF